MSAVKRKHWKYRFEDREGGSILWLLGMKEQVNQENIPEYEMVQLMP